MEDPAKELADVAALVTGAVDPEVQKAAVLKYYAPDMGFRHPLALVEPAPNSRDELLAILDWYRILSPVDVHVNGVTYDAEKHAAFVDVTQVFHIRWSPLKPAPSRLIVHFTLRPTPSPTDSTKTVYVIAEHEDYYHPDDLAALVVPPLVPLIRLGLRLGALASRFNARLFGHCQAVKDKDD